MNGITRMLGGALMILGASVLFTHQAWAPGADQPSGEPPFGLAPQSDAQGTRLTGVFAIEFLNTTGEEALDGARGLLRLRRGQTLGGFFSFLAGPVPYGQASEQQEIRAALIDQSGQEVIDVFLPGEVACTTASAPPGCRTIKVKRLEEFRQIDSTDESFDQFFVMDVELAVK